MSGRPLRNSMGQKICRCGGSLSGIQDYGGGCMARFPGGLSQDHSESDDHNHWKSRYDDDKNQQAQSPKAAPIYIT